MIEDKELDALSEEVKNKEAMSMIKPQETSEIDLNTQFSKKMEDVKQNILINASTEDDKFVETVKKNVKEAAVKLTEVEKDKANLQQQKIKYDSDKITTKQKQEEHTQHADKWEDKRKKRQYHYDGVKPIMEFVGIEQPMNLFFLYALAILLSPLFLIAKLCKGTFGALLTGANDKDRSKAAKGFLWTLLCVFSLLVLICVVYLFLKTQGINLLANIKS